MVRVDKVQTNFIKGILSPRIRGRIDFEGYFQAVDELENLLVLTQGGILRRSGTRFVAETKFNDKEARLLPFQFSVLQTYMIEAGELYMRFFSQEAQLLSTDVTAAITNGDFTTNLAGWTDESTGGGLISHDIGGDGGRMRLTDGGGVSIAQQIVTITEGTTDHFLHVTIQRGLNPRGVVEGNTTFDDTVFLRIGSATGLSDVLAPVGLRMGHHVIKFNPASNDPVFLQFRYDAADSSLFMHVDNVRILDNEPIEIETDYLELELGSLKFTQSADIMFLAQGNNPPMELQRLSVNEFSLVEHDFLDGPYLFLNDTPTTMTLTAVNGVTTLTASSVQGVNGGQGFLATDIGRLIRIASGPGDTWAEIIGFTSTLIVTVYVRGIDGNLSDTTAWRLGAWRTPGNYPQVTTFHEERLFWGAQIAQVQTSWSTKSQDFNNYEPSNPADLVVTNANAITVTIASNRVNAIRWFSSTSQGLLIGTAGSEAILSPASTASGLAPGNVQIRIQSKHGSLENVDPAEISKVIVFPQRDGREIRTASPDQFDESFTIETMSILAENLFRTGVKRLSYAQAPIPTMWVINGNNLLTAVTVEVSQRVLAWGTHPIGGVAATVDDIATIPEGLEDQLWLIAKRTIGGGTKRFVEFIETIFESQNDIKVDAFFVDSGKTAPSGGLVELVTNGTFTTDLSGWVVTGAVVQSTGAAEYGPSGSEMILDQGLTTAGPDVLHRLALDVTVDPGDTNQNFEVSVGTTIGASDILAVQTLTGSQIGTSFTFTPGVTSFFIRIRKASGTVRAQLDNVTCKSTLAFVTGLTHLIGETVQILVVGATHPDRVVDANGIVTLDTGRSGSTIHVGLQATARVKLLPIEEGSQGVTTIGKTKRPQKMHIRFLNTVGAEVVTNGVTDTISFRQPSDPMNVALPPFTGIKSATITAKHDQETDIEVRNSQPLPLQILNIIVENQVYGSGSR